MVLNNVVDAAAVDSNVLSLWLSEHQEHAEELHVMCSWGPWPVQPIVVNNRLPGMHRYALVIFLIKCISLLAVHCFSDELIQIVYFDQRT